MRPLDIEPIYDHLHSLGVFTREDIVNYFTQDDPNLSEEAARWRIHQLEQRGVIHQSARGTYQMGPSQHHNYQLSPRSLRLAATLTTQAPLINTVLWEHRWLNTYSSLQSTMELIHLDVERNFEEYVFNLLKSNGFLNIFLKPTNDEFHRYATLDPTPIRINTLVSRAPTQKYSTHKATRIARAEKIAIDLIADPFLNAATGCATELASEMVQSQGINYSKLTTYAQRRSVDLSLLRQNP